MKKSLMKLASLGIFLVVLLINVPSTPVLAGNPPDPANSSLVATSPGSAEVPADGTTTASVTLTFRDAGNTPLIGDAVTISAPGDPTAVIAPSATVTDASGEAVFTVTSTTAGTDQITAVDGTTGTILVALGQVIFDPVPTSAPSSSSNTSGPSSNTPSCPNALPTDAPNFYQLTANGSSATIYFVEPRSQFDGYTISYGLNSNADSYTVTFNQDRIGSASKYTIHDLYPKSTYYFKIRANNGCAPGPWSAVKNSGKSAIASLPATGSSGLTMLIGFMGMLILGAGFILLVV